MTELFWALIASWCRLVDFGGLQLTRVYGYISSSFNMLRGERGVEVEEEKKMKEGKQGGGEEGGGEEGGG